MDLGSRLAFKYCDVALKEFEGQVSRLNIDQCPRVILLIASVGRISEE